MPLTVTYSDRSITMQFLAIPMPVAYYKGSITKQLRYAIIFSRTQINDDSFTQSHLNTTVVICTLLTHNMFQIMTIYIHEH